MTIITQSTTREIVTDFAKAIREKKTSTAKPATHVINFRNELKSNVERPVEVVPIDLLRYRKDNGRIASDVMNYEKLNGPLDEKDKEAQEQLRFFLERKHPEMTESLIKSIQHSGQREPAIITCDGFLINGNRRKMAFESLRKSSHGDTQFDTMKVVILPGPGDEGGPPTLLEIERLENRYQLQSEGKSEYYGFDRALSIRRKMSLGFSLIEQLHDDPRYANLKPQELEKEAKECERDFLLPLECAERYLNQFGRDGIYESISKGMSDKEGRWQAFIDYSKFYHTRLTNSAWQIQHGIDEDDIGAIENAAFKMIRLRTFKDLVKIHQLMRQFTKLCALKESRQEILKISDEVDSSLPKEEQFDADHNPLSWEEVDLKWGNRNQRSLIYHTKKALDHVETSRERETPVDLLEAALKKLTHENLTLNKISYSDFSTVRKLISEIDARTTEIEHQLYDHEKKMKKLTHKK